MRHGQQPSDDDDADTCGFSAANGDLINANPKLGALRSNGGPTETMALLSGSPAIEAVRVTLKVRLR